MTNYLNWMFRTGASWKSEIHSTLNICWSWAPPFTTGSTDLACTLTCMISLRTQHWREWQGEPPYTEQNNNTSLTPPPTPNTHSLIPPLNMCTLLALTVHFACRISPVYNSIIASSNFLTQSFSVLPVCTISYIIPYAEPSFTLIFIIYNLIYCIYWAWLDGDSVPVALWK